MFHDVAIGTRERLDVAEERTLSLKLRGGGRLRGLAERNAKLFIRWLY